MSLLPSPLGHRTTVYSPQPLLTSPPSSRSTVYAVFLPYAMVPIKQITHNVLKLLALPRGLEPLFSP